MNEQALTRASEIAASMIAYSLNKFWLVLRDPVVIGRVTRCPTAATACRGELPDDHTQRWPVSSDHTRRLCVLARSAESQSCRRRRTQVRSSSTVPLLPVSTK